MKNNNKKDCYLFSDKNTFDKQKIDSFPRLQE